MSCSECSYDSEACTCTSANRCYCSLGVNHEHAGSKLPKTNNLDALFTSCGTEDKCYCSLSDGHDGSAATTTWCDSDSCISTTKCYCKTKRGATAARRGKYTSDNLALDYELFTIGNGGISGIGGGQHVKASEALSAKKSVEMAALFADFNLSQTTDIKNLGGGGGKASSKGSSKRDSGRSKGTPASMKNIVVDPKKHHIVHHANDDYHGLMQRPVSATLEDSLGYLP